MSTACMPAGVTPHSESTIDWSAITLGHCRLQEKCKGNVYGCPHQVWTWRKQSKHSENKQSSVNDAMCAQFRQAPALIVTNCDCTWCQWRIARTFHAIQGNKTPPNALFRPLALMQSVQKSNKRRDCATVQHYSLLRHWTCRQT